MLFNSFEFLFYFLPVTLLGFFVLLDKAKATWSIMWLVVCSLFFYGWWNPAYLVLMLFSIVFNFSLGYFLGQSENIFQRKLTLWFGVSVNIGLLVYFKYANFLVTQVELVSGHNFGVEAILLPLAISFFTFQQVAFLVDSYRHQTKEYNFSQYSLFVVFFPQLIAGPIVHHKDVMPQFLELAQRQKRLHDFAIGISIFAVGLFKKTVIADGIAPYSNVVFDSAMYSDPITFFVAWGGVLAYTIQLYFDFSGYSDMAIGLARMFGIILPLNFYSPYKAKNIVEFWRRWHITLSNFLRDYLYITLGGNRNGVFMRYRNLFLTMFIGGLWHGAGWNFAIWGALHGSYLIINHLWLQYKSRIGFRIPNMLASASSWLITFLAVVLGWVFFRAQNVDAALNVLAGMSGLNGITIPNAIIVRLDFLQPLFSLLNIKAHLGGGEAFIFNWLWVLIMLPLTLILPNTQDIFSKVNGSLSRLNAANENVVWPFYAYMQAVKWNMNKRWLLIISLALTLGLITLSQVSEFLYFQF